MKLAVMKLAVMELAVMELEVMELEVMELEVCSWIPRLRLCERGVASWQGGGKRSNWR
jgi:hypothetical protein